MFHVDFDRPSMQEPSEKEAADLGSASEMNLRYGYFMTDVTVTVDGWEEPFPGTTLLDFIFGLLWVAGNVRNGKAGRVGFTESDVSIGFQPEGSGLTVLRSFDPVLGRCGTDELLNGVNLFVDAGLDFIVEKYPVFAENETYHKLRALRAELE